MLTRLSHGALKKHPRGLRFHSPPPLPKQSANSSHSGESMRTKDLVVLSDLRITAAVSSPKFKPSLGKIALLSLRLLGTGFQTAQAMTSPMQVLSTTSTLAQSPTEALKVNLQNNLGRRDRKKALKLVESLENKGLLDLSLSKNSSLAEELVELTSQDLAKGVKRKDLVLSTLSHLDNPQSMSQGRRGTCQVTALQNALASKNPTLYVRLIKGLSSPQGTATLPNGDTLSRAIHSIKDNSQRDVTSRLMQSAFIDYGNGSEVYDNKLDKSTGFQNDIDHLHEANPHIEGSGHFEGGHSGLFPNEITRVLKALFPGGAETHYVNPEKSAEHVEHISQAIQNGQVVTIGLNWRDGQGHALVVKKAEDNHIVAWNTWGVDEPKEDPGPSRESISKDGLIRMSKKTLAENLWVYQVATP